MVLFTQLSDRLKYPPSAKAKISSLHSVVIAYVAEHFTNTRKFKQQVVDIMNSISYYVLHKDAIDILFDAHDPLDMVTVSDDQCKSYLGNLYIHLDMIKWDVDEIKEAKSDKEDITVSLPHKEISISNPTPKEHLYIQNPTIPRFDYSKVFISGRVGTEDYVIYASLPEVPMKQCDISATTDIDSFTTSDLIGLYPNQFIPTRSACFYNTDVYDTLEYNVHLGYILPVCGFEDYDILHNVIEYPHFYKLMKWVDGKIVNFYDTIEIDGKLYNVLDIWGDLPESKQIPKTSEFIKEYVVRRYLLERDNGVKHKYPMFGDLQKFLTLFMPFEQYREFGYNDQIGIANQCVAARISYKQSRNPIMRRLLSN